MWPPWQKFTKLKQPNQIPTNTRYGGGWGSSAHLGDERRRLGALLPTTFAECAREELVDRGEETVDGFSGRRRVALFVERPRAAMVLRDRGAGAAPV